MAGLSIGRRAMAWFLWNVGTRPYLWWYLTPIYRYKLTSGSDRFPKAPFILVSNHGCFFDPWFVGTFTHSPLGIMCNDDAFRGSALTAWYLKSIGAFPKKKGASDYRAMKETLQRLAQGIPVCIFPEGQTTWNGETQLVYRGIEKLAKRGLCPLVMARVSGSFLCKPWWANSRRRGRVLITLKVLSREQVRAMSDEELFEEMRNYIRHSDIKDPENQRVAFTGENLAEGLERFVWQCMHCAAEDTLEMKANRIRCTACNSEWTMDAHCRFTAVTHGAATLADLQEWSYALRRGVLERISKTPRGNTLTSSPAVVLQTVGPDGYHFVNRRRGTLSLTADELSFDTGQPGGESLVIPTREAEDPVIQQKDVFELLYRQSYYRFVFDHHSPMKWVYYLRYLNGYEACEERGYL